MSPFGLFIGRLFNPSPALKPLLDGYSELQVPDAQAVCALGEVDLGEAVQLKRFYLDDEDYWLQVLMNGNEAGDTVLFGYHSAIPVRDQAHLQQVVGSQSSVGMPIFEHDGYMPDMGMLGGDQTELTIDNATGTIIGWKPITPQDVADFKEENGDNEEDDEEAE